MDATTTAVLNDVFQHNINVIVGNADTVTGAANEVLFGLACIHFMVFLYKQLFEADDKLIQRIVEKLFLIIVVALITFNWGTIAGAFKGYIAGGGAAAGGGDAVVTSMNPAAIASDGFVKVATIFDAEAQEKMVQEVFGNSPAQEKMKAERARRAQQAAQEKNLNYVEKKLKAIENTAEGYSPTALLDSLTDAGSQLALQVIALLLFCTLGVIIILVHFYVALQIFILTIDWYLTVSITNLLIPFALNKHTSSLASAALQAVVRKSVQLGVLLAVLGMFNNAISGNALGPNPSLIDVLSLLLGSLTMAFLVKGVPQIANGIFAGGGSAIDVGSALGAAASAAGRMAASAASSGVSNTADYIQDRMKRDDDDADGANDTLDSGSDLAGLSGQADQEPTPLEALHNEMLSSSEQVDNHVERAEAGEASVMSIDGSGNVQGADRPEQNEPPQDPAEGAAYASGLDAKEGFSAQTGFPAVEQVPKTQQMSLAEQAQNYASTQAMSAVEQEQEYANTQEMPASDSPGSPTQAMSAQEKDQEYANTQEMSALDQEQNYASTQAMGAVEQEQEYGKTQAMSLPEKAQNYASTQQMQGVEANYARTQQVSVSGESQTSERANDWENVPDTSPDATTPQEDKGE